MFQKASKSVCTNFQQFTHLLTRSHNNLKIAPLQQSALSERCILVDELDRPLGEASKQECHRVGKNGTVPLHRAFSVFLFNQKGDLLLQKRSPHKV